MASGTVDELKTDPLFDLIESRISAFEDDPIGQMQELHRIREILHELSPNKDMPIDLIHWVPVEKVQANDYNPNAVPKTEMNLLYVSVKNDGYTQPVVTIYDEKIDKYVIIDGFHRYSTLRNNADLQERTHGLLPIVVLRKDINDRMASTVRHNRARGKHSVEGMSNMVYEMLKNGWKDEDICNELGMSADELVRLKHVTGFSKLFKDAQFRKEWKTKSQLKASKNYRDALALLESRGEKFDPFNPDHQEMVRVGIPDEEEQEEREEK